MRLFHKNPLLRPKNATFCPGCPQKDLLLNKEFNFDINIPELKTEEIHKPTVSLISDKILKKTLRKNTLF